VAEQLSGKAYSLSSWEPTYDLPLAMAGDEETVPPGGPGPHDRPTGGVEGVEVVARAHDHGFARQRGRGGDGSPLGPSTTGSFWSWC
jgi:hypothetical protein